ncbi:hypothetical protein [Empedobacter tilapiae]
MKKTIYILSILLANTAFSQVLISRETANLNVHSSVGFEARSDRQGVAFPEYNITNFTVHPYNKAPKEGSIVFSQNKNNGTNEDYYGYFFWNGNRWVKLLDANSFVSNVDYNIPYFFSNFNSVNEKSTGIILPSTFGPRTSNTDNSILSETINSKHEIGADIDDIYWRVFGPDFQPSFKFSKDAKGLIKVNALLVKPGGGSFDYDIAMGVFINDKLVATKVYQFSSLNAQTICFRKKVTLLAPFNGIVANTDYKIKLGFRIIGNNYFNSGSLSFKNYSLKSDIMVGEAFANTISGTDQTRCGMSAFESPVNITVYGVSN